MSTEEQVVAAINTEVETERTVRFSLGEDPTLYNREKLKPIMDFIAKYKLNERPYPKVVLRGEYFGEIIHDIFGDQIDVEYGHTGVGAIEDGFTITFFVIGDSINPVMRITVSGLSAL